MRWAKVNLFGTLFAYWVGYYGTYVTWILVNSTSNGDVEIVCYIDGFEELCLVSRSPLLWIGIIGPALGSLIQIYFYICLKSYAEEGDINMLVYQQPMNNY